ncbi:MAG: hypothetical protein HYV07_14625 [Deltaproteobacteria bacterium]|nr:hypothetical protein [Deltaproteobacteria bacterium]
MARVRVAVLLLLAGCRMSLGDAPDSGETPDGGSTTDAGAARDAGGADSGGIVCSELGESLCKVYADCKLVGCRTCAGEEIRLCYKDGDPKPLCPACASCELRDEESCEMGPGCRSLRCPDCNGGGDKFAGCIAFDAPDPGCPSCTSCAGLSERECAAPNCTPHSCPDCTNGGQTFVACLGPNESAPSCPQCLACEGLGEGDCESVDGCTPVFESPSNAGAPPYARCAQKSEISCTSTPACGEAAPRCPLTYHTAHDGTCWVGCIHALDCL